MSPSSADRREGLLPWLADGVDRLSGFLGRVIGYTALIGSVSLMFYEVLARYVFDRPTRFTIEYGLILQIVLVGGAAAYVLREGGHVEIELITERLSPRARRWAGVVQSACGVAVSVIFAWQVWGSAAWSLQIHKLTLDMQQPVAPFQFFLFGGLCLLGLQFAVRGLRFYWAAREATPSQLNEPAHQRCEEAGP